jgi:hypothetical protein
VVEAKDDSPLPRLYCLDRTEGKGAVPPWEEAAPSNDDRVGVVCEPLVADVVEPTDLRAVDCHDPVALGGGEQATELRLPPQALLGSSPIPWCTERSVARFPTPQDALPMCVLAPHQAVWLRRSGASERRDTNAEEDMCRSKT